MREERQAFFELQRVEDPMQEKTKKVIDLLMAVRPDAGEGPCLHPNQSRASALLKKYQVT